MTSLLLLSKQNKCKLVNSIYFRFLINIIQKKGRKQKSYISSTPTREVSHSFNSEFHNYKKLPYIHFNTRLFIYEEFLSTDRLNTQQLLVLPTYVSLL